MTSSIDPSRIEVVDERVAEILRGKTVAQRVAMITSAHNLMRKLIEGPLRQRHGEWTDEQIAAEVARRMLLGSGTTVTPRG